MRDGASKDVGRGSNEELFRRRLPGSPESFLNLSVLFQRQRVKCVTHCAPPGDAGAQALASACLVETTAGKVSV